MNYTKNYNHLTYDERAFIEQKLYFKKTKIIRTRNV